MKYAIKPKNIFFSVIAALFALMLVSWGPEGHRAIATIAWKHLTPAAKAGVRNLLGRQWLEDVSTWADEVRSDPEYKSTGSWHYVNIPPGDDYSQFAKAVKTMRQDNVYKATLYFEQQLKSPETSRRQKIIALKFLVHFIGDMHQPMHVSNGQDKGGNDIMVTFDGQNTNLHSLWDSGLIDHSSMNEEQLAKAADTATPLEISRWQHEDMMTWLWESYQISTILYREAAKNPDMGNAYYKSHFPVLEQRIEKAGIRLAGVLNAVFAKRAPDK